MKRILFIADGLGSGGAERQMVTVACELKTRGYDVCVLCYSTNDFYASLLRHNDISIKWIEESRQLFRMLKVRRFVRNGKYDAVVSFLETPNFLNNFSALGPHNWKVVTGERSSKNSTFQGRRNKIYMRFQRFADVIVCNSDNARKKWQKHVPRYADKLRTIYNTVTLGDICSEYVPKRDSRLHVVVAASHQYLKNAMGVARALALMDAELRKQIYIEWYGSKSASGYGSKAYDEVVGFVKKNNLEGTINFHDPTPNLADKMQQADVVALFSQLEGLPNTICEGMTIGKPIIMTRVSDYEKLVGGNGSLCDWDSAQSIKSALENMMALSVEQLLAMGLQSKRKAESLFSKEAVMEQWMRILE